ncbi:hypothetical protein [Streptomyces sp. Z26]|uniref:hypothetical protein n=1 Tax=Streptomyces sp. Z26 TaxID=2500177 RepID=UPI000EF15695|nr:hypothetical protein [Streptomyces sp. Z26]RLL62458.1 hypothetical protein D7M15_28110 [Streptomyces sp. Z26]RLL68122.1 hypothetical protein D7M15_16175 [Streptomyces sp. Z26]
MRAAVRRLGHRLSYRGAALLLCGLGWINYGIGLVEDPRYGTVRGVEALTNIMPIAGWGAVWITSGALSVVAATRPGRRDWWGWGAAAAPPAWWALAYTTARAVDAYPQGWYSGITWAVTPGLLAILAAATRKILAQRRELSLVRCRLAAASGPERGGRHGI